MIILYRLILGEPQKKIAENIGMSERHITRIKNSPVFQEELKKLARELREQVISNSQEVREIFNAASPDAARKLVELMYNAPEPKDQIKAADKIIEYSDFAEEKEQAKANRPIVWSQEEMLLIEERLRKY